MNTVLSTLIVALATAGTVLVVCSVLAEVIRLLQDDDDSLPPSS